MPELGMAWGGVGLTYALAVPYLIILDIMGLLFFIVEIREMKLANEMLDTVGFAENPDPRCPCVLILDTSGSMAGRPIAALNEGLRVLKQELAADELASRRVEIAIVSFGYDGVQIVQEFEIARDFEPPILLAGGLTPMGEAINTGISLLEARKSLYRSNAISYYRPWMFLISDGAPTDKWDHAARRVRTEEQSNGMAFFAVGVEEADMDTLGQIAIRTPLALKGLAFRELFQWLSASQRQVSASKVGDQVALPPVDWATV